MLATSHDIAVIIGGGGFLAVCHKGPNPQHTHLLAHAVAVEVKLVFHKVGEVGVHLQEALERLQRGGEFSGEGGLASIW